MASSTNDIEAYLADAKKIRDSILEPMAVSEFRVKLNSEFAKREPQRSLNESELRNALNWLIEGEMVEFNSERKLISTVDVSPDPSFIGKYFHGGQER